MTNKDQDVKDPACGQSDSTDWLGVTVDELRVICDATVRLVEIRQRGCSHLAVENIAPEVMRKMLLTLSMHKKGFVNSADIFSTGADV